jgi:hypothetical protein
MPRAAMLMPSRSWKDLTGFEVANARTAGLVLLFVVMIVWQIPHVLFLRYTLLIMLGALSWPTAYRALTQPRRAGTFDGVLRAPFLVYAAFLAWLLAVALGGTDVGASVDELRAEWLPTTLVLLLGFGAGIRFAPAQSGIGNAAVKAVFWALVLHAVLQLLVAAGTLFETGSIPFFNFGGISDHKSNVTYTNTLALALLLADVARGTGKAESQLGVGRYGKLVIFVILLLSTLMSATRNALIVFVFLAVVGGLIALRYKTGATRQWWAVVGVCAALTLAGVLAGLKADSRWNGFLATVPVAWDTEGHRAWLNGENDMTNLPRTEAGTAVDPSAYFRIAFAKEGVKLLLEHPWGTEIGRDTFRRLVHEKYGTAGMSHAHDGLLDLGLSAGFPGMALWVAFLVALGALGFKAWKRDHGTVGLALFLAVLGFGARMLMDSTLRDHIIEEFVMVAGLLAGAIAYGEGARPRGPA